MRRNMLHYKKKCNTCETRKMCMHSNVYEAGTKTPKLEKLSQFLDQAQWKAFVLEAKPTCAERVFTNRMFWLVGLKENR